MKKKFQRSDIPYKDRLLMQKHQQIADHRNEAARNPSGGTENAKG